MIIAIDGPAAAGKGTLARRLAAHLGFAYLDTGRLYRAVGMSLVRAGIDPANEAAAVEAARSLDPALLSDESLSLDTAGTAASKVAVFPGVREALLQFQRDFARTPPGGLAGAVLDGRDIGTTVCPDAGVKLFVTASDAVRARRRTLELRQRGQEVTESEVLADMVARDRRDRERSVAPLAAAADAVEIDTSAMTADEAFEAACRVVFGRRG
ncbi:(d)CMP kinase [Phaeovibrio sulfidiphilus]|uniref:Cytidylate kinase n=1 Tax=Phaeovibrio sulfidiphilus TaxID=1220600 RepID=A0A8J7CD46_9PROT|nr:(d)CMP kinase [Phaeovibrio sulfidiphilus]MBE1236679.1 (d)CMP kinase [Phaeovibrio sulfidiphilus]